MEPFEKGVFAHCLAQKRANPIALIENGTTSRERRVVGTLATIAPALQARYEGPAPCVIDEVVSLTLALTSDFHFESRRVSGRQDCGINTTTLGQGCTVSC